MTRNPAVSSMVFGTINFSTVIAALGAAGVGGLISAAFGVRARRLEQSRDRMLVAADEFAVEAAEVFVHLRHVKPPWERGHRNLLLVGDPAAIHSREDELNARLDRARRLSGRIRLLYGPKSVCAAHAAQFLRHSRYAAETAHEYWRELGDGDDPIERASGKVTRRIEKNREVAWHHLELFADEVKAAMRRPDKIRLADEDELLKGVPQAY